jgi:RimJ/RimL family protein N-acetyltransferase
MLFALLSDPGRSHLWGQRRILDEAQFYESWSQWSAERMAAKFIVEWKKQPIGLIFDYERSLEDGHTKLTALLLEEATGRGAGIIAAALFGDWLFRSLPLRKLYLDAYGFNAPVLAILKRLGVRQEMHRRQHRYWNGQYWDSYGFAIYREDYPHLCDRILQSRRGSSAGPNHGRPRAGGQSSDESARGPANLAPAALAPAQWAHQHLVDEAVSSEYGASISR